MTRFALLGIALALTLAAGGCKSDDGHTGIPPDAKIEEAKHIAPNGVVHSAAGDLALNQGNTEEAFRQYERALLINPKDAQTLYKLATLYTYRQQFDRAVTTWERYVAVTGKSANGYSNLGRTHELAGHWKQAEVSYLAAIARDPKNKAARVNYGILLAKRDRIDEAEAQLSAVLTPAEVQYNLGSVFELRRNYPAAKVAYGKAIDLDEKFLPARQRLDMLKGVTSAAN